MLPIELLGGQLSHRHTGVSFGFRIYSFTPLPYFSLQLFRFVVWAKLILGPRKPNAKVRVIAVPETNNQTNKKQKVKFENGILRVPIRMLSLWSAKLSNEDVFCCDAVVGMPKMTSPKRARMRSLRPSRTPLMITEWTLCWRQTALQMSKLTARMSSPGKAEYKPVW